ncbi:MAG: glycosyltransferase WbuB [Proteobacteria bacterium]|nr:glycosyltransferase WbuB [Pseudomonadota bacterium]
MHILIHGINFSPELTGIGKYTGEMGEWLAAQGHEVRVVTAPPYYPQWKMAEGYVNRWSKAVCRSDFSPTSGRRVASARGRPWLYGAEAQTAHAQTRTIGDGVRRTEVRPTGGGGSLVVYRCPLWVPAKPSGLKRIFHLASFALFSFPVMLRQIFWRPDVVWVVEPALFCAPQAWLVARLSGGKAWLHIQDYEVDAAFDLGLLKGQLLRRLVAAGERWLMRRFDRVSTISQRMLDKALAKGVDSGSVVLFRNWVEIQDSGFGNQKSGTAGYRAELGIAKDAVVALYSGNMGAKQGLEILAEAARICGERGRSGFNPIGGCRVETRPTGEDWAEVRPTPEIVFVFCGAGAGRDELVALCEDLPDVRFLELQPAERLSELLAMADIHLLPQRADAADLVMPSKLTGMLASGRPVVATAQVGTELASVVADCGLVVPPGGGKDS